MLEAIRKCTISSDSARIFPIYPESIPKSDEIRLELGFK